MSYISPEIIEKVKQIDLKSYLETFEPQELVRVSPGEYSTRTHDSLKISHGKWMWWSRGIGGKNAVDYLMKVKEMTFYEAVKYICELTHTLPTRKAAPIQPQNKAPPEKYLQIPEKTSNNDKLIEYLQSRGISKTVIDECIKRGCIYESMPMHNIAFVGFDDNNKPRYIGLRGLTEPRFIGDSYGSDKRYTFRLLSDNQESLHLFEGSIDLLSYATLIELNGGDWKKQNLMTLSGVYNVEVEADSYDKAVQSVTDEWKNGDHILDADNFVDVDFDAEELKPERIKVVLLEPDKYDRTIVIILKGGFEIREKLN